MGILRTNTISGIGSDGPVFQGVAKFDTQGYFVPPSGTTEQRGRGRGLTAGGFNTSAPTTFFNSIEYINIATLGNATDFGDLSANHQAPGSLASSTRGIFAGGMTTPSPITYVNIIEYVTISSTSNVVNFGDLSSVKRYMATCASSTRGIFMGGEPEPSPQNPINTIEFITIASLGSATSFGELQTPLKNSAGLSNSTRGIIAGGQVSATPNTDTIEFVTIASTGDATDFGNLTQSRTSLCAGASSTRGIVAGGRLAPTNYNIIDFITIASTGNAQDFGDLIDTTSQIHDIMSNSIRGVRGGGNPNASPAVTINTMEYVTISSTGNAQDFGDLIVARREAGACSDSHGGLS
jgi:hypothetical protein